MTVSLINLPLLLIDKRWHPRFGLLGPWTLKAVYYNYGKVNVASNSTVNHVQARQSSCEVVAMHT